MQPDQESRENAGRPCPSKTQKCAAKAGTCAEQAKPSGNPSETPCNGPCSKQDGPEANWLKEKADLTDTLQRLAADFDNYKKRAAKEKQENDLAATAELIQELIPVIDSFEMAIILDKDPDLNARKGREMVYASLISSLENKGLAVIDAAGKPFDPRLHEALLSEPGEQKGIVIEVLQKGYTLNGKVIRTAKVKVSS